MSEVEYSDGGKFATFRGERYTRDDRTGYYLSTRNDCGRRKRLHVAVWEAHNGPVPHGMHVHHSTVDKGRNEIRDLELMSAAEHERWHAARMGEERRERMRENLISKAVPASKAWHASEDGRRWHSEQAKRSWGNIEPVEYSCSNCGKTFTSRKRYPDGSNRFCCNACKSAFRRKSGADNVTKTCERCGDDFITNRYSKARFCQRCAHKGNSSTRG